MPNPVLHQLRILSATTTSTLGAWRGSQVLPSLVHRQQPAQLLKLYDMEGSPYCRIVREALSALHLDVEIYPCPKGGKLYRPEVARMGGKQQFPYFVDPNTGVQMYESADIVDYLFTTYGDGSGVPALYRARKTKEVAEVAGTVISALRGIKKRGAKVPVKPLNLWSFEASPFSRVVRERLTELEIPYVLHNLAKERWQDIGPAVLRLKPGAYEPIAGGKRDAHFARTGHMQVPYLEDPNTDARLLESAAIMDYLENVYGA